MNLKEHNVILVLMKKILKIIMSQVFFILEKEKGL